MIQFIANDACKVDEFSTKKTKILRIEDFFDERSKNCLILNANVNNLKATNNVLCKFALHRWTSFQYYARVLPCQIIFQHPANFL